MKKIITTLLLALFCSHLYATHVVGGEISYSWVSGLTYKVKLKLHRDCLGSGLGTTALMTASSINLSQNINFTSTLTSSGILNTVCSSVSTTCTDPLSLFPGFEYYIYEGTVTLPAAASDWKFEYNICCRNASINNLVAPASANMYVYSSLDNLNSAGGFNNSVNFVLDNSELYAVNQTFTINQAAIDIDGDSLSYSVITPMNSATLNCTFSPGCTIANPLGSAGSFTINPSNGDMTFHSTMVSVNAFAIKVDEYRNGLLIASSIKDFELVFLNAGTNAPPSLSGINGGTSFVTSVNLCSGSSISFTLNGTDPNPTDSVHLNVVATDITGYTATTNGALQETMTFNWTPTAADIRPQPYLVVVEAKDNSCINNATYGYLIYVNQCNVDSVWAGDANADYTVNNYDVLNIGIGNGTTGIARPGATTNWVAEYCSNWSNSFISGINYKHADCNGDGTIDASDMAAVTSNYGQVHLKTHQAGSYKTAGFPDLYVDMSGVIPTPGATIQVPVMLGSSSAMMNNFYGIATHFNVNTTLSSPISFTNNPSWIGNATNTFLFTKNSSNNDLACTIVRNDHNNVNGSGQIGLLTIPISSTAVVGSDLIVDFTDVKLIANDGTEITDYNVINDTLKIVAPNAIGITSASAGIDVYPNPMTNELTVNIPAQLNQDVVITINDMQGNVIIRNSFIQAVNHIYKLNTSSLASGNYMLHINTASGSYMQKLSK